MAIPAATTQPSTTSIGKASWRALFASCASWLGWMFDGYESYAFILVITPAVRQLLPPESLPKASTYAGGLLAVTLLGKWLDAKFADVLREQKVALALTDTSFALRPWEMEEEFDLITADFAYVRWLGDRKGIEKQTTTWDKPVVDRREDLSKWVELVSDVRGTKSQNFCLREQPLRGTWVGHGKTVLGFME